MLEIIFKHWKTGEELTVFGKIIDTYNNPGSDRLVIQDEDGQFQDIIKSTIVEIKEWT